MDLSKRDHVIVIDLYLYFEKYAFVNDIVLFRESIWKY